MEARTVADSRSVLVHWMGPTDANSAGFVHGGVVMELIDEVSGLAAVRHSSHRVATAGADRMTCTETPDELRREADAQLRRTNRLAEHEQILAQRGSED